MRASRLLRILLLLESQERTTAAALARDLEVSERTVYRDLDALAAAGVPVYGVPGEGGGYRLVAGYRSRLTSLHADEADALALAGLPDAAAQLGLSSVLAAAQTKLAAALPEELRGRAGRIVDRFHLDDRRWFDGGDEAVPHLAAIADAVWAARRIRVTYGRGDHPARRTLHPLGLVLKAGRWYLVATHRGQVRTYRVGRVRSVETLDLPALRPAGFDLADAWRAAQAAFDARLHAMPVTVRVGDAGLAALRRHVVAVAGRDLVVDEPAGDGWRRARFLTESVEVAHALLLQLGADVEVVAPAELRARTVATVRAMTGVYRTA